MARQETLTDQEAQHNPLDHGLWQRYTTGDNTNHAAWLRAHAEQGHIGTCRIDGGRLRPHRPTEHGILTWYEATCVTCHHTYAAPAHRWETGGRVLRRSSAHHEMPTGWFTHRQLPPKPKPAEAA
jgi:hypothetical protein